MSKRTYVGIVLAAACLMACAIGCGGGGDDSGYYACSYESRVTDGCDGYGFGEWTADCYAFNADDYYITPEEVCDNVTSGGYYCEAGCCIDKEFRNVELNSGYCD